VTFPKYPEYRDSGVEWLGEVPAHWRVAPVIADYQLRNGYPFSADLFSPEGEPAERLIRIRDILGVESQIFTPEPCPTSAVVQDGDVLIGMDGDFNVAYWDGGSAKLNQRVCAIRGRSKAWDRYFYYAIGYPLGIINDLTFSTTVKHLSSFQVLKTRIAYPPEDEMITIVSFLDHETTKIDALVEEQKRLIELLKEKRQAVISHAVTKGLDPNVPMKDSGVEWLGEVPAHWESRKISHAFDHVGSGTTPPSSDSLWYEGGDIPWVTTGELREKAITETQKCVTQEALAAYSSLRLYPPGTILIAMYGATIGRLGILGIDATTNQACCALVSPRQLTTRFVFYWFNVFRENLISLYATGGGQPKEPLIKSRCMG
jgi:type I restriction enzyme, S subunit